ncbi:YajD family HNH nuclease [Methylobacter sp. S3L5C]|uniref:YajD family HNH nuclease n=1 Tax=Methylobacter sp. S3L5C TaxID=2839024 RepID=UPI001FAB5CA5|nr:YajD family HNH nuclease [Methylobacter sp. S3L5C]UOA08671.1 YajD family HNH nuclease [Methylobacter sp. S3L5C]
MTLKKTALDKDKLNQIVTDARRNQEIREQSYRGQALKLYPWICGRCTREFTHTNLTELTVHHKNHNHDDNPADGSNWELLCLYCHDNEHSRYEETRFGNLQTNNRTSVSMGSHNPFADLKNLMGSKK